ncbi:MAG: DUF6703 family protein [Oryzihumus sp.]
MATASRAPRARTFREGVAAAPFARHLSHRPRWSAPEPHPQHREGGPVTGPPSRASGPGRPLPYALPVRDKIERASVPVLTFLGRLPRLVPFFILLVLLLAGAIAGHALGFFLMGLAALFVGWLLYLAWPSLTSSERLMRSAVVLLAAALAITQLFPRG